MQSEPGVKRIPVARATNLRRLKAPAGYVLVIEDVEYGNRFIIVRLQEVNSRALARAAAFPFETEVSLVFSASDAAELALELHERFAAGGDLNEWFDLDRLQVAQLRDFGRPAAPSLRDLALSAAEGQSLVEKSSIVSALPESPPVQAQTVRSRPQRRWPAWLLLAAIVALGASVLGNAPQLRRLLSELTNPSPTAVAGAGDFFYVSVRANARVCASRVAARPLSWKPARGSRC